MASRSTSITAMAVDSPIAQSATRGQMDAADRRYLDDQILGSQRHLVDSLVSGVLCTWAVVDGSSPTLATGDAVVLSGVGTKFAGQADVGGVDHEIPKVTLATTTAITNAGGRLFGIVVAGAAPGANVKVAVAGLLPPSITGVSATSGFAYVNQSTGRITTASSLSQGDVVVGSVGLGSVVTAGFDYARSFGIKTPLQGAGDEAALSFAYTVNKPSGNDDGLVVSMTDTASPGTSRVVAVKVDGSYVLYVDPFGSLQWPGSGSATAAGNLSMTSGGYIQIISTGVVYFGSNNGGSPQFIWRGVGDALVRTDTMPHGGACTVLWAGTVTSVTYKVDDSSAGTAGKQMVLQAGRAGATGTRRSGGDMTIAAGAAGGDSGTATTGGSVFASAGSGSSSDGTGGSFNITGGAGGSTNGNGGNVVIRGGDPSGTGTHGSVVVGSDDKGIEFRRRIVTTIDATTTTVDTIPILDNTTVTIFARVTGDVSSGANSGVYFIMAGVKRTGGGAATLVGVSTTAMGGEDDAAWDAFVDVDGGNNARVRVKGAGATTVSWISNTQVGN